MCERMRMQLTVLASRQIALANRLSGVDVTIFKSIDFTKALRRAVFPQAAATTTRQLRRQRSKRTLCHLRDPLDERVSRHSGRCETENRLILSRASSPPLATKAVWSPMEAALGGVDCDGCCRSFCMFESHVWTMRVSPSCC